MIREVLLIAAVVAVALTLTVGAALRLGGRIDREQPPMPASPSPILGAIPIIAVPDPLLTEADFDRLEAWLATQRREGSR